MGSVLAALRILADVAIFRFRRLEMANIVAALSICVAVRLPVRESAFRLVFLLFLNILSVLTNDYYDVDQDLASPDRDGRKTLFLKRHMREAFWAQIALAVVLAAAALIWYRDLLLVLVLGAGNCWLYSWKLKRMPVLDVVSIGLWGAFMPMASFPLDSRLGWCLLGELALFSACFEVMQVMRDRDEDELHGVRTTAVWLGCARTTLLLRILLACAAIYGVLVLHPLLGLGIIAAQFVPFHRLPPAEAWNQLRLILGVVWLAIIGWVWWSGAADGLLTSVSASSSISWLDWMRS